MPPRFETLFSGKVVNYEHAIPRGGLFEYVSCPHYFMEIIIYLAFLLIGGLRHITLLSIVLFVVTNQLVSGCLTHRWYRAHFAALYPVRRKAVVPFLLWKVCQIVWHLHVLTSFLFHVKCIVMFPYFRIVKCFLCSWRESVASLRLMSPGPVTDDVTLL